MKKILIAVILLNLTVNSFSQEIAKENKETIFWIKEKIVKYGIDKLGLCRGDLIFAIYNAENDYIECGIFKGYINVDLKECEYLGDEKIYYNDIISFSRSSTFNCYHLNTYNKGSFLLEFSLIDYHEPEQNFFTRMDNALNNLIKQNKILYPIKKEKY